MLLFENQIDADAKKWLIDQMKKIRSGKSNLTAQQAHEMFGNLNTGRAHLVNGEYVEGAAKKVYQNNPFYGYSRNAYQNTRSRWSDDFWGEDSFRSNSRSRAEEARRRAEEAAKQARDRAEEAINRIKRNSEKKKLKSSRKWEAFRTIGGGITVGLTSFLLWLHRSFYKISNEFIERLDKCNTKEEISKACDLYMIKMGMFYKKCIAKGVSNGVADGLLVDPLQHKIINIIRDIDDIKVIKRQIKYIVDTYKTQLKTKIIIDYGNIFTSGAVTAVSAYKWRRAVNGLKKFK